MKHNVLAIMCDQFRYDCIHELGNSVIQTPNIDRLVKCGTSFQNAYSSCPVCIPARYSIMTGREAAKTGCYCNEIPTAMDGLSTGMQERCGKYLAEYMKEQGYRTFGIGKFHTHPDCYENLGFETHLHTEELWSTPEIKRKDAFAALIVKHPEYSHIDQVHGERTNMYYVPQASALPKELTVESVVADWTVELLQDKDARPYFGFVSFVGPHPPCAPPIPYNFFYDPDCMPNPLYSDKTEDHMDEQISFMNYAIWAEDISNGMVRNIKSRYYGEITYIDACIGKILDAIDARGDADNTIILFFADHGDHLGDHFAWQKESFFEASVRVPFIVSAPMLLPANTISQDLVSLIDIFGIVTKAANATELRDGIHILSGETRESLFSLYGRPGTPRFKIMVRKKNYKYIYMANGGCEQLFDLQRDPYETKNLCKLLPEVAKMLLQEAQIHCQCAGLFAALENEQLKKFDYESRKLVRIHQFEFSKNIYDFNVSSGNFIAAQ